MNITILCDTNDLSIGASGRVVETQLGWLKLGDRVLLHLHGAEGGRSSLQFRGREYDVVVHAFSSYPSGRARVFARMLA